MKRTQKKHSSTGIGILVAVATFLALSFFNSGLMEFSKDMGLARWLMDEAAYALAYKFAYKLAASVVAGCLAGLVGGMIAYRRDAKLRKRIRATRVQFRQEESGDVGRTA